MGWQLEACLHDRHGHYGTIQYNQYAKTLLIQFAYIDVLWYCVTCGVELWLRAVLARRSIMLSSRPLQHGRNIDAN